MNFLTDPLKYEFFVHGILAASMVGGICALIGVYIVLRRMSYIGHGLSHAVFGGAVVSTVIGWNFYIGAGAWGFLSVLLINAVARRKKVAADAAIGVITTASFAVGVAIISRYRKFTKSFEATLFGNILGVTTEDLWIISAVVIISASLIFIFYRQFLFTTFDEEVARIYGVPVAWIERLFSLILASIIIVSMQVMGVTMIAAGIIMPAVTARVLTDSFNKMVFISTFLGIMGGTLGMYLSFYFDVSSGATIVLVAASFFAIAYSYTLIRDFFTPMPKEVLAEAPLPVLTHAHAHGHSGFQHQHEHKHEDKKEHQQSDTSSEPFNAHHSEDSFGEH